MAAPASAHKTSESMAVMAQGEAFKPWTFELNPLGPNDVEIKITHCGMCMSDLHTVKGDWGPQNYPIVPGHEIVGHISALGANVKEFAIGQRVGVGPQALSCRSCEHCQGGQEVHCDKGFVGSYGSKLANGFVTKGGYALYNRTDAHFVFPIPDNLPSAQVAPILCAGITTFTPLKNYKVPALLWLHMASLIISLALLFYPLLLSSCSSPQIGPGKRVGVIGIGGLGHMALQFARALGAEVTALSSSPSKEEEAKKFGAHKFLVITDPAAVKAAKRSLDLILNTASAPVDVDALLNCLRPNGTLCMLGLPPGKLAFAPQPLIYYNVGVAGSIIGPPGYFKEMFELCSKNNILSAVEVVPWTEVEKAREKVEKNTVRYRMVLEMPK